MKEPVPEYGAVPPDALTEAEPSANPLQDTLDTTEQVATSAAGSEIVTEQEAVQPFASVTVYEYVPAARPVKVPSPEYGAVPPEALTEAEPSVPPLQETFESTEHDATSDDGCVMTTELLAVHPNPSVTVTE